MLSQKRDSIDGASLFCTIPSRRSPELVALLVAYEVIADYVDEIDEQRPAGQLERGRQLQAALIEAVAPANRSRATCLAGTHALDGGYLETLVSVCRTTFNGLPSSASAAPYVRRAAELTRVLCLNHEADDRRRDRLLAAWAREHLQREPGLIWFESPAAASAWLPVLVLLALASEEDCTPERFEAAYYAYHPWISLLGTMLDSYVDMRADLAAGRHSYAARYGSAPEISRRLVPLIRRALREASSLYHGARHEVIVASMTAMFLSSEAARAPGSDEAPRALLLSAGWLSRLVALMVRARKALQPRSASLHTAGQRELSVPSGPACRVGVSLPRGPRLPTTAQTLLCWRFPLWFFDRAHARHGSTFTVRVLGQPPFVFFSKRDDIAALFRVSPNSVRPGEGASVLMPVIGDSSFMLLDEPAHMSERRTVMGAFRGALDRADPDAVEALVRPELRTWPKGSAVAMEPLLRSLALKVILAGLFGVEAKVLESLHRGISEMLARTPTALLQEPYLRTLPIGRRSWKSFCGHRAYADDLIYSYLDERRREGACKESGIDALLCANAADGSPMSLKQAHDHIMTLILSGHETTAAELAWALLLLAHNPAAQDRLVAEVDEETSPVYMNAVIRETLRHRPVFPFTMPRHAQEPIVIAGRLYTPPVSLLGCIYLAHHDSSLYPRPQSFLPERFLDRVPESHAWLPWGGGHRRCPGHLFASVEMRVLLRAILSQFAVCPVARRIEPARWHGTIVTPNSGARVVLSRRCS